MITLEEIKNKMKIVYFGTPDFASYILQYILEQGTEVVGVVTNPDKPAGRGHKLRPSAVKEVAMKYCPSVSLRTYVTKDFMPSLRHSVPTYLL